MELKVERSCYRSSSVASRPGIWFSLVESSLREPLLLNFLPSGMGFTIITGQAQCCAQYSLTLPRKTLHMRGKKESKLWGHNSSSFFQSLINPNYCHLRHFPQILISKMAGFTFACG
jgi:hypothetical protein